MRKRLIHHHRDDGSSSSPSWLEIEQLAQVEITSEDPAFPIESALIPGTHPGWRAASPGAQMIRLVEQLMANGTAYLAEDGSVYFAIGRFPAYGRLSRLDTRVGRRCHPGGHDLGDDR